MYENEVDCSATPNKDISNTSMDTRNRLAELVWPAGTQHCAATVRKPQTWGRGGQNLLFRTSLIPSSWHVESFGLHLVDIAQIMMLEHVYRSLEVDY